MNNKKNIKYLTQAGMMAALYILITLIFAPISFGPIQFRVSEALTVLPLIFSSAIPGLSIGVFLANLLNPESLGMIDIIFGTLATFLASLTTYFLGKYFRKDRDNQVVKFLLNKKELVISFLPAVIFNGLIVGIYLPFLLRDIFPELTIAVFLWNITTIALSEALVVYTLGLSLYLSLKKFLK